MPCLFSIQLYAFSFDPSARPRATRLHDSYLPQNLPSSGYAQRPAGVNGNVHVRTSVGLDDNPNGYEVGICQPPFFVPVRVVPELFRVQSSVMAASM